MLSTLWILHGSSYNNASLVDFFTYMPLDMYVAAIADRRAFAMLPCIPKVLAVLNSFEMLLRVINKETTTSLM
jgi:hypothetical protein